MTTLSCMESPAYLENKPNMSKRLSSQSPELLLAAQRINASSEWMQAHDRASGILHWHLSNKVDIKVGTYLLGQEWYDLSDDCI